MNDCSALPQVPSNPAAMQPAFSSDMSVAKRQYDELLTCFSRQLLAFLASRVPRSDLDDTSQAVWTRIWERKGSFVGGNFRSWMFEIARNYMVDVSRKKRAESLAADYDYQDERQSLPIDVLLDRERFARLDRCLERLDRILAELVRGRLRNESYDELAVRLAIEPSQAHRRLHTAKQQLRDCVGQGDE